MKVKVCRRGYESMWVFENGDVNLCCLIPDNIKKAGNLKEHTLEEIYQGENAKQFRESMYDGSYRYCKKSSDLCPWIANNTLEQHLIEVDTENEAHLPNELYLAYEQGCNYSCKMCNVHQLPACKTEKQLNDLKVIEQRLRPVLNKIPTVNANGQGELFVSKYILDMLTEWKPEAPADKVHVLLETNGSLFNEKNWAKISCLGQYNLSVTITILSFEERTYQYLSGTKLPLSNLIENLKFIKKLREEGTINYLELGIIIQESNFRTLPEFTKRCIEEFGADVVRLRPFLPLGAQSREIEWFMDVRNPYHPFNQEYVEVMKDPIFSHPKAFKWSGDEASKIGTYEEYVYPGRRVLPLPGKDNSTAVELLDTIRTFDLYISDLLERLSQKAECCEKKGPGQLERLLGEATADFDPILTERVKTAFRQMTDMDYVDAGIRKLREKYPHVVIVGTGKYGRRLAEQLNNCGIDFDGFAVSDGRKHVNELMGKPVWSLKKIPFSRDELGVIMAVRPCFWNEVRENIKQNDLHYVNPFAILTSTVNQLLK